MKLFGYVFLASGSVALVSIALIGLPITANATPPSYRVVDLRDKAKDPRIHRANALNDSGQFAGELRFETSNGFETHAYFFDGKAVIDLALVPRENLDGFIPDIVNGMNNSGDVVGTAYNRDSHSSRGFLYRQGKLIGLLPPGTSGSSDAYAINDMGTVVGQACGSSGCFGFQLKDGTYMSLGSFRPTGINNHGAMFGWDTTIWMWIKHEGGSVEEIAEIGCVTQLGITDLSLINDAGQVAFNRERACDDPQANGIVPTLYMNGTYLDIFTTDGFGALGLNNFGEVAGYRYTNPGAGPSRAWLYSQGTVYDLNELVKIKPKDTFVLDAAWDINHRGQIIVEGRGNDGATTTFLLEPIGRR